MQHWGLKMFFNIQGSRRNTYHTHTQTHTKELYRARPSKISCLNFLQKVSIIKMLLFLWEKHTGYNESIDHQIVCRMNGNWGMISSLLCTDLVHILLALICKPVSSFYCPSFLSGKKKIPQLPGHQWSRSTQEKKQGGKRYYLVVFELMLFLVLL